MQSAPTPRPGRPVRGSRTGRPMMAALDLLGQRWTLRVVWELQQDQPLGFRELGRRTDGMSSSVLADRLQRLGDAGIVATDAAGRYKLTELGDALGPALEPLRIWATRWAEAFIEPDPSDAGRARCSSEALG